MGASASLPFLSASSPPEDWLFYSVLSFCGYRERLGCALLFKDLSRSTLFWQFLCQRLAEERSLTLLMPSKRELQSESALRSIARKLQLRGLPLSALPLQDGSLGEDDHSRSRDHGDQLLTSTAFFRSYFYRLWQSRHRILRLSLLSEPDLLAPIGYRITEASRFFGADSRDELSDSKSLLETSCRIRPKLTDFQQYETEKTEVVIPLHQRVALLQARQKGLSKVDAQVSIRFSS